MTPKTPPRGIRNNNPFNIRKGPRWQGLAATQPDPAFATFETPVYGIRAGMKLLLTYQSRHGIKTIRALIARFAPPNENDTVAYVAAVCKATGVNPDDTIGFLAHLIPLARAIVRHECGDPAPFGRPPAWYGDNVYAAARDLLLPPPKKGPLKNA